MNETFGQRFARLRKEKGLTQEDIAFKVNISAQAVSKWENDISLPDIMILSELSEILGVTTDTLLGKVDIKKVTILEEKDRKDINKMFLRIIVNDNDEKVKVNLPLALLKVCIESGMSMPQISGNEALKNIDFKQIYEIIESGVVGEIVSIEGKDGETVSIVVE